MPEKNRIPSLSDSVQLWSFVKLAVRGAPQPSGNSTCQGPSRVIGAGVSDALNVSRASGSRPGGSPARFAEHHKHRAQRSKLHTQFAPAVVGGLPTVAGAAATRIGPPEFGHQPVGFGGNAEPAGQRLRLLRLVADEIEVPHPWSSDGRSPAAQAPVRCVQRFQNPGQRQFPGAPACDPWQ